YPVLPFGLGCIGGHMGHELESRHGLDEALFVVGLVASQHPHWGAPVGVVAGDTLLPSPRLVCARAQGNTHSLPFPPPTRAGSPSERALCGAVSSRHCDSYGTSARPDRSWTGACPATIFLHACRYPDGADSVSSD